MKLTCSKPATAQDRPPTRPTDRPTGRPAGWPHIYIYIFIYIYMQSYIYMYILIYTYIYIYLYIYILIYIYIYVYIFLYLLYVCICLLYFCAIVFARFLLYSAMEQNPSIACDQLIFCKGLQLWKTASFCMNNAKSWYKGHLRILRQSRQILQWIAEMINRRHSIWLIVINDLFNNNNTW